MAMYYACMCVWPAAQTRAMWTNVGRALSKSSFRCARTAMSKPARIPLASAVPKSRRLPLICLKSRGGTRDKRDGRLGINIQIGVVAWSFFLVCSFLASYALFSFLQRQEACRVHCNHLFIQEGEEVGVLPALLRVYMYIERGV